MNNLNLYQLCSGKKKKSKDVFIHLRIVLYNYIYIYIYMCVQGVCVCVRWKQISKNIWQASGKFAKGIYAVFLGGRDVETQ